MTYNSVRIIAFVLFAFFTIPATAQTVQANRTTPVAAYHIYNKQTCAIGPPVDIEIIREPKHGSTRIAYERRKIEGKCKDRTARIAVIYYTPQRGYRGADEFVYRATYSKTVDGRGVKRDRQTVKLQVK